MTEAWINVYAPNGRTRLLGAEWPSRAACERAARRAFVPVLYRLHVTLKLNQTRA